MSSLVKKETENTSTDPPTETAPTRSTESTRPHTPNSRILAGHAVERDPSSTTHPKPTSPSSTSSPHPPRPPRRLKPKVKVTGLSNKETVYPSVDAHKAAFSMERDDNPLHRRCPTPHVSKSRATKISNMHKTSETSLRSKVSFDSTRSRRTEGAGTGASGDEGDDEGRSDGATIGPWDPVFGGSQGIGPAGEAIEVIGLGRKKPRHRVFQAEMLKPALRSTSRSFIADKPLPSRPISYVAPFVDGLVHRPGHSHPHPPPSSQRHHHHRDADLDYERSAHGRRSANVYGHSRHASHQPTPSASTSSFFPTIYPSRTRPSSSQGLRGLFASLTIDRPSRRILPAEDLFTYLRLAEMPVWENWPPSGPEVRAKSSLSFFGRSGERKGIEAMGWEWMRRLEGAEHGRMAGRALRVWEPAGKWWETGILEFQDDNVPSHPIDPANRWGQQVFALAADGFDTLEYYDDNRLGPDHGLLSWLTGSILQTAVSALHMLRYSANAFTFHLIPSPIPPYAEGSDLSPSSPTSPSGGHGRHGLWEGFGSLVLVSKSDNADRAMILQVRPPDILTSSAMKELARPSRAEGWWHFPPEGCCGDAGQANLVQAQTYDECLQNQVFFFAITNLKQWVFGQFNSTYTKATLGPVIERRDRDPSVLQALTTWLIRSVDERPRAEEQAMYGPPPIHHTHQPSRRASASRHSRRPSTGTGNGNTNYDFGYPQPSTNGVQVPPYAATPAPGLPGYHDAMSGMPGPPHIGQMSQMPSMSQIPQMSNMSNLGQLQAPAPPGSPFGPGPNQQMGQMGYGTWSSGSGRGFSPISTPYGGGVSWYAGSNGFWPGMRGI